MLRPFVTLKGHPTDRFWFSTAICSRKTQNKITYGAMPCTHRLCYLCTSSKPESPARANGGGRGSMLVLERLVEMSLLA